MKIICLARTYAKHAKELGNPVPENIVLFMKPATSLLKPGNDFYYPEFTKDLHHECELVVRIGKNGKHIDPQFARNYIDQLTVGLDLTARDLQADLKSRKHPWEIAKAFDHAAPIGKLIPLPEKDFHDIHFELKKNGESVQTGHTKDLLFKIEDIISYISQFITLQQGDLIFTGTPEGVGSLAIGDHLEAYLEGEKLLDLKIK
ncbi:MAG: fumarylacetoacetate hydrolase family protein [Saprospiraceae bacterium]|nr:fumarylacetoacetate hydrolase family protein [Saprospiraceae bacterium]